MIKTNRYSVYIFPIFAQLLMNGSVASAGPSQHQVLSIIREADFSLTRDFSWILEKLKDQRIYLEESESGVLRPYIESFPICDSWIKTSMGNYSTALGEIESTENLPLFSETSPQEEVFEQIVEHYPNSQVLKSEHCWEAVDKKLILKLKGEFEWKERNYKFEYLDQRLQVKLFAFDATASIKVFPSRPTAGVPQIYEIPTVENGYLTSSQITASTYGTNANSRLFEVTNIFDLSQTPESASYDESASFVYGMNHLKFFQDSYKFNFYSSAPIKLVVNKTNSSDLNNAMFIPTSTGGEISIGRGDGFILKNLGKDEDVVSHELGHYLIFKWIYEPSSLDALTVHEGLADFFVYDRTDNNCLGESICPSTKLCVSASCLRTGNAPFKFDDPTWLKETSHHKRGQLLATLLWNIRAKTPSGTAGLVAFNALSKVTPNCSLQQFIIALLYADLELFQSKYRGTILEEIRAIGMSSFVNNAETNLPPLDGALPAAEPSSSKPTKWWQRGCSTGTAGDSKEFEALWLLLFVPFVCLIINQKKGA